MKKLLSILLMLVYTAASSGTVMSAHFCMGELAGISFGEKVETGCGYCGMEESGCCHDFSKVVKLDNSQLQKTTSPSYDHKIFLVPRIEQEVGQSFVYSSNCKTNVLPERLLGGPPLFLRNCVFRI